ncbi:RHS repeat-associated core domain-containing protein [Paenibacillus elgii]|uniref:hypothetical protein n=1 Tax=Paenibacillus elgii TaxID=189691 RepID=UPI0011B244D1|nr:hypothetical protein [Paenibacillus elgii]
MNLYTYGHNNPLRYLDPTGHAAKDSRYDQNQVDYLNSLVTAGGGNAILARKQLNQGKFYVDPNERGVAYTVTEMDTGTPRFGTPGYDWTSEAAVTGGATAVAATCIYSCGALIAARAGAADIAGMGTTIATGTVVAARTASLGTRAWNTVKGWFSKGEETTTLYRSVSEAELISINTNKAFESGIIWTGDGWLLHMTMQVAWGQKMDGGNTRIISIELPTSSLSKLHFDNSRLDGVGNAYYAETDSLNSIFIKVTVVK